MIAESSDSENEEHEEEEADDEGDKDSGSEAKPKDDKSKKSKEIAFSDAISRILNTEVSAEVSGSCLILFPLLIALADTNFIKE